jgi:hypothetical protein
MSKLIDDVTILRQDFGDNGPPILFSNVDIRRMLSLARPKKDEIFYDLGCGWGQNLIIAATELGFKKCVGIEKIRSRSEKARRRVERLARHGKVAPDQILVHTGLFEDVVADRVDGIDIREATIIFYGLSTDKEIFDLLDERLTEGKKGCRLVNYYDNGLFPEALYDRIDHPFYLFQHPFKPPPSSIDWLKRIYGEKRPKATHNELWQELAHDYQTLGLTRKETRETINDYKRRLPDIPARRRSHH